MTVASLSIMSYSHHEQEREKAQKCTLSMDINVKRKSSAALVGLVFFLLIHHLLERPRPP